jgi:hypothetical protein
VVCPLCGTRRAKRGCPALDKQICAVCCGTKRLVQIRCPSDCAWLATAREHPPATVVRQRQQDVGILSRILRDLSERQSQLLFLVTTFLATYQPTELHAPIDDDVVEAISSLAATFETASRGLIYDHRPASVLAERLATSLRPVLEEAGRGAGSSFERDAAVVLRRLEDAVRDVRTFDQTNRQAFLELLRRVMSPSPEEPSVGETPDRSRLIVP